LLLLNKLKTRHKELHLNFSEDHKELADISKDNCTKTSMTAIIE